MRRAARNIVLASLVTASIAAVPRGARAQEVQLTGPLAGQPAIHHLVLHRQGRAHLTIMPTFTINDEYIRHLMLGLRAEYNFFDFLALGLWGTYGLVTVQNRLTDEVQNKAYADGQRVDNLNFPYSNSEGTDFYPRDRFPEQLGRMQWVLAPQLTLAPLRGKLGLFGKAFLDVDVFMFLGAALVGVQERASEGRPNNEDVPSEVGLENRVAFAPTFGGGLNMYFNRFMGMTLEYRALPFSWNRSGTDECCTPEGESFPDYEISEEDRQLSFNQMFSVGLVFALPATPRIDE